jgi:hypothetical protein
MTENTNLNNTDQIRDSLTPHEEVELAYFLWYGTRTVSNGLKPILPISTIRKIIGKSSYKIQKLILMKTLSGGSES